MITVSALLEKADKDLSKKFGKNALITLSAGALVGIPVQPTGIPILDKALGVGGLPWGRIIEILGPESSGKTTIILKTIAMAQKQGKKCAIVDAEHAINPEWARVQGVNLDDLLISQPECGEEALEIAKWCIDNGIDLVAVDSVASLVPRAELDGDFGDSVTGDTPIMVRKHGKYIDFVSIASLYGGSYKFYSNKYTNQYKKLKSIEVLTAHGWKKAKRIVLKNNVSKKPIIMTNTLNGISLTTKDHSLFVNGEEKSPAELKIGDKLDMIMPEKKNIINTVNADIAWLIGYFCAEGSKHDLTNNVFGFGDTHKDIIDKCESILKKNFTVYTRRKVKSDLKEIRKDMNLMYVSGDELLSSILNQCRDNKINEKRIPACIINGNKDIKVGFLEGFKAGDGVLSLDHYSFSTASFMLLAGIAYIFHCLDIKYHITGGYRKERGGTNCEFIINQVNKNIKEPREITRFHELPAPEFLYDIETEDGTFVGGAGGIVHHNSHMGLQARLMGQAMRKLTGIVNKHKAMIIFSNQIREKIGVVFGSNETSPGGRALKFYASIRMDIRKIGSESTGSDKDKDKDTYSNKVRIKVVKNKVAPPFKQCEFNIDFQYGLQTAVNLFAYLMETGAVEKRGSWFSYKGEQLAQGERASFLKFIEDYDADAVYDNMMEELKADAESTDEDKLAKYQDKLEKAKESEDKVLIKKYTKLVKKYTK